MPDDFLEVRRTLDTLPVPPLPSVDVAAIYRDALDAQTRSARRWKRAAAAAAALAAGVLLFALLPKLEVRCDSQEFSIRWGAPPAPPVVPPQPAPDPRIAELLAEQRTMITALRDANVRHAELQDLIVTVARDVSDRDGERKQQLIELVEKFREFETVTARQFQEAERTNTALYHAVFPAKTKGDSP